MDLHSRFLCWLRAKPQRAESATQIGVAASIVGVGVFLRSIARRHPVTIHSRVSVSDYGDATSEYEAWRAMMTEHEEKRQKRMARERERKMVENVS